MKEDIGPEKVLQSEVLLSENLITQNDQNPPNQDAIALPTKDKERKEFQIGVRIINIGEKPYILRRFGWASNPQSLKGEPIILACGQSVNLVEQGTLYRNGKTVYFWRKGQDLDVGNSITDGEPNPSRSAFAYGYDDVDAVDFRKKNPKIPANAYIRSKFFHNVDLIRTKNDIYFMKQDAWCKMQKNRDSYATNFCNL